MCFENNGEFYWLCSVWVYIFVYFYLVFYWYFYLKVLEYEIQMRFVLFKWYNVCEIKNLCICLVFMFWKDFFENFIGIYFKGVLCVFGGFWGVFFVLVMEIDW